MLGNFIWWTVLGTSDDYSIRLVVKKKWDEIYIKRYLVQGKKKLVFGLYLQI